MKFFILLSFISLCVSSALASKAVSEAQLQSWLHNVDEGLVYVWSPQMPLSILGRSEIIEVAKKMKIELLLAIDPYSPSKSGMGDPQLQSKTLIELGVLDHFPAIVVIKNGLINRAIIQGYEQKPSLEDMIRQHLDQL